ncbi:hypothetical protein QFC19_005806 [Naganishia cerealis]|uniref:Uncharacterized protein n=1 Tax=Naganishia cerealis TaxID=610337 RepID=A0ACC2VLV9_9TREE|nr:hypothetical protein QFC19_005806 [Naganishia cerealis]
MHGTFRPSLMKLVSSNEETKLEDVTFRAFHVVTSRRDSERETLFTKILEAISILTELRGIGPASASLLLSVRFPEHVPFFSDEAYRWLTAEAGNPWTASIKYNAKEYASMLGSCLDLATRLGVHAVDIERAGWVLGREKADLSGSTSTSRTGSKRKEEHAGLDESASSDTGVAPHKRSKKR